MKYRLVALLLGLLCSGAIACAQEKCDAEIKLLLDPSEVQSAVKAFKAGPPAKGEVYLFDTKGRELFSRGVIVRARRQDATADLMVKVRVPAEKTMAASGLGAGYKCEIDRTGHTAVRSYSVKTTITGALPSTGDEVLKLLSPGQKRLLADAQVTPDWSRVERVASIHSTRWNVRNEGSLSKLTLELWRWSRNEVLELSTRIASDDASMADQLGRLASSKGLSAEKTQTQKTRLAVEDVE